MASLCAYLVACVALAISLVEGHVVLTYPGWRGDNLITNETFPYGMQWMYPCESNLQTFASLCHA